MWDCLIYKYICKRNSPPLLLYSFILQINITNIALTMRAEFVQYCFEMFLGVAFKHATIKEAHVCYFFLFHSPDMLQ